MGDIMQSQGKSVPIRGRPPILWALPVPHPRAPAPVAHFLTLGAGAYTGAARRISQEARNLGVFTEVHNYTRFNFITPKEEHDWAQHLRAWREHGARIAGYGWWKPVLCQRH